MTTAHLTIDLDAVAANWQSLDRLSGGAVQTAAVVKADAYGLGVAHTARALARAGARRFFVAVVQEGATLREVLGPGPQICVLSGHMAGNAQMIRALDLTPMLVSLEQILRHLEELPGHNFGVQLDTGMNRLGVSRDEWAAIAPLVLDAGPDLLMSHLACSDAPDDAMNSFQLDEFLAMTKGAGVPRSLAATGGILLGPAYHFELTRPGIGLYGGMDFEGMRAPVQLALPIIQTRELLPEETVGYGCTWRAARPSRIATVSGGYADGVLRALSNHAVLWHGDIPCPQVGRVSMDTLTVDITDLDEIPKTLELLGPQQDAQALAHSAQTISYEILTSLGHRYKRDYRGGKGP